MTNIKLGSLRIETDLLLAPMMDVTTPPYIMLCKHYGGVGLYTMPMVFVNQIVAAPKTIRPWMEFVEKNRPSGIQICGSGRSSDHIQNAMEILNSYNFDFVDINSGCPARHTCNSGGGASLLKPFRFNELHNLVKTTISSSNKPVSVKIRLGWDTPEGLDSIIKMVEQEGADFLTVHGRIAIQGYGGQVNLEKIKYIKQKVNIPVVGNGDVECYQSYKIMKEITGVDAVMIGRAAQGHPTIFSEILKQKDKSIDDFDYYGTWRGRAVIVNSIDKIREYSKVLLDGIEQLGPFWNNDRLKHTELHRNIFWMLRSVPNTHKIKPKIGKMKDIKELTDYIFGNEFDRDLKP